MRSHRQNCILALLVLGLAFAANKTLAAPTGKAEKFTTIGDVIKGAGDRPTHIVFVHGMRAEGPDTSATFRGKMCAVLDGGCSDGGVPVQMVRHFIDLGSTVPSTTVGGERVWANADDWQASRPFVDRYVFHRPKGGAVIIDEVNWWPLLFPLKCKMLVAPESRLSGPDKTHLELCASSMPPYHSWLKQEQIAQRPDGSGGAMLNGMLKQQIMNWGLSDAVIALGPMQSMLRQSMDSAFDYAATGEASGGAPEFVVVSESLGSFVVLDTFQHHDKADDSGVRAVLSRTYNLYFFANQFRLLELGRLAGLPETFDHQKMMLSSETSSIVNDASPIAALVDWAEPNRADTRPRQIVAFNDPSDALTFDVPSVTGADVFNVPDHNGFTFFGLFENPVSAHTGHSKNPKVLKSLFGLSN